MWASPQNTIDAQIGFPSEETRENLSDQFIYHTINASNSAPGSTGDVFGMSPGVQLLVTGNQGVLANDIDADADVLQAEVVEGPKHGVLSLNPDGAFSYTPSPGFSGGDRFSYRAYDGIDYSSIATAQILVNQRMATAVSPTDLTADDFNEDGLTDLAVTDPCSDELLVFLGDPDGTLADGATTVASPSMLESEGFVTSRDSQSVSAKLGPCPQPPVVGVLSTLAFVPALPLQDDKPDPTIVLLTGGDFDSAGKVPLKVDNTDAGEVLVLLPKKDSKVDPVAIGAIYFPPRTRS